MDKSAIACNSAVKGLKARRVETDSCDALYEKDRKGLDDFEGSSFLCLGN